MKFFIAQGVTGENIENLKEECNKIKESLNLAGHNCYCTLDEESFDEKSKGEMMEHAFNEIDNCDGLLVIIRNENKSEGMLMEVGYVLGKKKKIVLLIKQDVKNTYLRDIADKVIEFDDFNDLLSKLKNQGI